MAATENGTEPISKRAPNTGRVPLVSADFRGTLAAMSTTTGDPDGDALAEPTLGNHRATPQDVEYVAQKKHSLALRWMHWLNFPLLMIMMYSGMRIYWSDLQEPYAVGIGGWQLFEFWPDGVNSALQLERRLREGDRLPPQFRVVLRPQRNRLHDLPLAQGRVAPHRPRCAGHPRRPQDRGPRPASQRRQAGAGQVQPGSTGHLLARHR